MLRKSFLRQSVLWVVACLLSIQGFAITLSPSAPVTIASGQGASGVVAIAGNSSGFMAVWIAATVVYSSFSTDGGKTWGARHLVTVGPADKIAVGANESGFVVAWGQVPPGGSSGPPAYANFSSDLGVNWSSAQILTDVDGLGNDLYMLGNSTGFAAVYTIPGSGHTYSTQLGANFSADGLTWEGTVGFGVPSQFTGTAATGLESGFFGGGTRIYFSTNGTSWNVGAASTFAVFTSNLRMASGPGNGVIQASVDLGEILGYFSNDAGMTVTSIGDVPATSASRITLCANDTGYFFGWVDGGTSGLISFSSDDGATWGDSVEIPSPTFSAGSLSSTIFGDRALFTWIDGAGDPVVSYLELGAAGPTLPNKGSFFRTVEPNHPGRGLFGR